MLQDSKVFKNQKCFVRNSLGVQNLRKFSDPALDNYASNSKPDKNFVQGSECSILKRRAHFQQQSHVGELFVQCSKIIGVTDFIGGQAQTQYNY